MSNDERIKRMKQYEMPGQSNQEVPCSNHPDAPHGFNRNASHANGRYTCDCEDFDVEMAEEIVDSPSH